MSGGIPVGPKKRTLSQLGLMLKPINWFFAHFVCVLYPKNNLLLIELKFYLTFKFWSKFNPYYGRGPVKVHFHINIPQG